MCEREERHHAEPPSPEDVLQAVVEFVDELMEGLDGADEPGEEE